MLSSSFKTSWALSDVTKAKWMSGGTLRLDRRKPDVFGRVRGSGYKVYIKPATYLAILEKSDEILTSMRDLAEEADPQPTSIHLHGNSIIQLSYFQKDSNVAEMFPYYGIHMLDEEGCIIVGAGINLTQSEFDQFLHILKNVMEHVEKHKSPLTYVKQQMDMTDGEDNRPVSSKTMLNLKQTVTSRMASTGLKHITTSDDTIGEGAKKAADEETPKKKRKLHSDGPENKKIVITLYGWGWTPHQEVDGLVRLNGKSQGGWFVDPKRCLEEAMLHKPAEEGPYKLCKPVDQGSYKLNTITRKKYLNIDRDMFDAALGKLVNDAVNTGEDLCDGQNESSILGNISFSHIYALCEKAIRFYQVLTDKDTKHLMNVACEYEKDKNIFVLLTQKCLNKYFVELFDYIVGK